MKGIERECERIVRGFSNSTPDKKAVTPNFEEQQNDEEEADFMVQHPDGRNEEVLNADGSSISSEQVFLPLPSDASQL